MQAKENKSTPEFSEKLVHINDLLSYEGEYFVYECYKVFLNRDPDTKGLSHYMKRLGSGVSKRKIIAEIRFSAEGERLNVIVGGLDGIMDSYKLRKKIKRILNVISSESQDFYLSKTGMSKIITNNELREKIKKIISDGAAVVGKKHILSNSTPDLLISKSVVNFDTDSVKVVVDSLQNKEDNTSPTSQFWFDLTTSMEWRGGVVGIIRAELEVAAGLAKRDKSIKFCMQCANGFVEIKRAELDWLFNSKNVADSYMDYFNRRKNSANSSATSIPKKSHIVVKLPYLEGLYHPFKNGDTFLSMGWIDSQKEIFLNRVKMQVPGLFIGYLIYDTILCNIETKLFYSQQSQLRFENYLKWVSYNCDFVLFGGENTKKDCLRVQQAKGWPSPKGASVKFGTDIVKVDLSFEQERGILADLGIKGDFIITVGTIEPRKNHSTLHKAYLLALKENWVNLPQLVFCGRSDGNVSDMLDMIERNPALKGKIIIVSPTDVQLAILYKHCLFTLLPSLYEGWSLTLPESLGQGKFCLTADVPPLREIANNIVDFVPPFDTKLWADKIISYSTDKNLLARFEKNIAKNWINTSWQDCANNIYTKTNDFVQDSTAKKPNPEIWFDLTTSYLHVPGVISGIIRVELSYAKYLYKMYPNVHFMAFSHGQMFEIGHDKLQWLFENEDISSSFRFFYDFWSSMESEGKSYRNPFTGSDILPNLHPARMTAFPDNALVFLVNIDWGLDVTKAVIDLANKSKNVLTAQFIHDVTPIVVPHLHQIQTCELFTPFFELCSNQIHYLQYGGHTAEIDGIRLQGELGWNVPPSDYIRLASDFFKSEDANSDHDRFVLSNLGIDSNNYIITVGTIEPRKNHEVLYKAYLNLLSKYSPDELPQLVFVGKPGWNSNDFISVLSADQRIKNKIVIKTPNDHELDVIYRNCKFSLLPSFYEGYSLTLNETLSYGKYCLTSDTPPLREVGKNLVEYIDPLDVYAWADRISFYALNRDELLKKEQFLKKNWHFITWKDSTQALVDTAIAAQKNRYPMLSDSEVPNL